jgi:hypothetical protein
LSCLLITGATVGVLIENEEITGINRKKEILIGGAIEGLAFETLKQSSSFLCNYFIRNP